MAKSLNSVIGYRNMLGLIQATQGAVPADILPPQFLAGTTPVEGDSGDYYKVDSNRQTARLVQYGAPSVRRELKGVIKVPVKLLHTAEHVNHDMNVLTQISQFDNPALQRMGLTYIAQETARFRALFNNLRVASVYSILANGNIWFDGGGNLLPSATGAVTTVSFGVPALNQGQLDPLGTGAIISASWAAAGTDIGRQILNLQIAAVQLTGYPIRHAFYGKNVLSYLLGNTLTISLLAGNPGWQTAFGQQVIPSGLYGLQWHPVYEAFYMDAGDPPVPREFFGPNSVVFTPEPSPDWWSILEGSYAIPRSVGNIRADAVLSAADLELIYGMFSYCKVTDDPAGIKQVAGDTMLPVLKVPKAIFQGNVVP